MTDTSSREWIEVVGVVGHTKHEGLDAENRVQLYLPYRQRAMPFLAVAVRTAGDPAQYVNAVATRGAIGGSRTSRSPNVRTMEELHLPDRSGSGGSR